MSFGGWSLFVGVLLVTMVLAGTVIGRLPLSSAMVYLLLGWMLGPDVTNVLRADPLRHAALLEHLAEVALLISLFAVGLRLGVPLRDGRWRLPTRLAFASMAVTVGLVGGVGVWLLDMPLGGAILLGAILAPTDPVLASGLREEASPGPDRVGFSLAGEGGLNDGAAFPFVMLGLGLLGIADLGTGLARWWLLDVLWSTLGGMAIGALFGAATGRLVVYLRSHHGEAVGLDEFLSLGLVAMAYGLAQVSMASGFLAVFAAGLAFQRVGESARAGRAPLAPLDRPVGAPVREAAAAAHASDMRESVQAFNEQLERLAELALVVVVGAMLAYAAVPAAVWWFVPLMLVVIRPLSALVATVGEGLSRPQQAMIGWFGIRGVGSVYYLLFSLHRGIDPGLAGTLVSLTLWTVSASIVLHGISAGPLMQVYLRGRRT